MKICRVDNWKENPDAVLSDEMYWPTSNVFIPSKYSNKIYNKTVEKYMYDDTPRPAVIGKSSRLPPRLSMWKKLTKEQINPKYSILLVDDGAHRSIAAYKMNEGCIRATKQASPFIDFSGGVSVGEHI